ncbi:L-lactate utilization operon repressor [Hartmannibacter diazotrophicus]|uniref:L-lactate utilization operon repressor n=1 Tax=Hartmannibacter diazotrophicus TaxID=1482074 RepID=A0A2C9DCJ1_9HYPH|nr:FadR/GntR family transcriptional regulator [Hartmannibacter diazotrophicus]SON58017.1 L-lactate utilization operon repressor [Hartmannibacter diazotrophicus]
MTMDDGFSVLDQVAELQAGLVRRSVRDIVADKLATLIAAGILRVGDVLPGERDLASALQVSRETIRGGMQILAARGIIEISQGARTRVVSADVGPLGTAMREPKLINRYDLDSIHVARLHVERWVVADAAARIEAKTLRALEESLVAQRATISDPVRFLICDREFHTAIYQSSANPVLADFVIDLYSYMIEHRRVAVASEGSILRSVGDHEAILAALKAHDPEATVKAFDIHLERIYRTTKSVAEEAD